MRAIFSCAAYKNFNKVKQLCMEAEAVVNDALKGNNYEGILFLNPQFSFTPFVEEMLPSVDKKTLSLIVGVEKDDLPHIADALIRGLENPTVPEKLRKDLQLTFQGKGWL